MTEAVALCLQCDAPVAPPVELCSRCHAEWLAEEQRLNEELEPEYCKALEIWLGMGGRCGGNCAECWIWGPD